MTDIATLGIVIKSNGINEASSGLNKLTSEGGKAEAATNKLSSSFDGLNKYMQAAQGAFAALGMGAFVKQALDAALAMERINSTMKATAGTAAATARELAFVREESQRLGLEFRSTAEAYAKFSAASKGTSIEGEGVRKIFKGVSEAATAMRLTAEQSNGVFLALHQMMSKGTVQAEELRGQLAERLPGAFGMAAKAMGMTTRELGKQLELGKVLSSDLLPKLAEEMHKTYGTAAIEAATGGQAAINRFKNSVFDSASAIGTALMPAFTGILNILTPLMDYLKMFIGGIEILAVKLATLPDKAAAAWRVIKSGEGLFSTAGMAMYAKEKAVSDAAAEAAIADIMKKYMPVSAAKTAAEMAEEQSKVAAALAKEAGGRIATGLKTGLTSVQKEHQEQIKSFLKDSWEGAATEITAEDFTAKMVNKLAITTMGPYKIDAKPTGFTANPSLSLGVDLQIKSAEQLEQSEKDRLELLRLQSKELERQQAVIKYIADLNAANSATATSMVGMNSVGGFDSAEDQTANQMAVLADAHKSRLDMIELERTEKIASLKGITDAEKRAAEINTALNTKAELEKRKNTIATAAITEKSFKSQLSMTSQYVGMAGQLFTELASTQDQSSRSGFETAKAFNMAAAIMSTAAGIMAQFAAPDGALPSAWARAALVGVTGVIQVAKIASTSFGGGGGVVGAPSGSFGGSGGSSEGTGISNLPQQVASIQDSRTNESIDRLIESTDNSATVIGKLSKSIDSLSALFESGGGGFALANNAPNRFTQTAEIATMTGNVMNALGFGASAVKFIKGDLLGSIKSFGSSLFGGGWKTTGAGIQLGINNGDVMARDYVTSAKSGGLFGKSKSSISYTENSDASAYMDDLISPYISDLVNMARTLGTSVDTSKYSSAYTSIATAGRTPEAIAADMEKWFTATLQGMSLTVAGLGSAIGSYDDAYEALKSMNDALVSTNEAFALVGKTALQGSFDNAKYALSLQGIFGGMDDFNTAMDDYFSAMYTDTEQAAMKAAAATIDVNNAFAEMGLAIPSTNAAFNALRNSLDITTESGSALFASLTLLGPTFAEMTKQSEALAQAFVDSISTISESAAAAIRDIQNSTLSTESPEVRYARAQREFTYATPEMAGELGKSLLDASRSMFASGEGYMSDYSNVMNELTTLAGLDTTVDPNASTVAEIKTLKAAIVDLQKAIVDKLTVIEAPLVRVAANI